MAKATDDPTTATKFSISVNREKPATVEQLAAFEFEGVKRLAALPKDTRNKHTSDLVDEVHLAATVAIEIVAMDKAELVEKVRARLEKFGPALMKLASARESAGCLSSIIGSAEARLAVALAVV